MKKTLWLSHILLLLLPTGCVIEVVPSDGGSADEADSGAVDSNDGEPTSDLPGGDPNAMDPCASLPDGSYCGSDDQLQGYEGDPEELLACSQGMTVSAVPCELGCNDNPPGSDDECFIPGPGCGNGSLDPGEECEGSDPGDSTCQSEGHDDGSLLCTACQLDTSECCDDACSPGMPTCMNGQESLCVEANGCGIWEVQEVCEYGCDGDECMQQLCGNGNVDPGEECDSNNLADQNCQTMGFDDGELECSGSCTFDVGSCCSQAHTIVNAQLPNYTSGASGCALDNGIALKISAEAISDSTIRFHVRKTDNSAWAQAAVLRLYVGDGPSCGNPPNVIKKTTNVVVGQVTQIIDLVVDPYDAAWAMGETKEFWVGKSESGYPATRSSGTISINRDCN